MYAESTAGQVERTERLNSPKHLERLCRAQSHRIAAQSTLATALARTGNRKSAPSDTGVAPLAVILIIITAAAGTTTATTTAARTGRARETVTRAVGARTASAAGPGRGAETGPAAIVTGRTARARAPGTETGNAAAATRASATTIARRDAGAGAQVRRRRAHPDPTRTTRATTAVTADAVTTRATATTRTNAGAGGKRRRLARQRFAGPLFARWGYPSADYPRHSVQREEKKRAKAGLAPVEWGKHGILTEAGQCFS